MIEARYVQSGRTSARALPRPRAGYKRACRCSLRLAGCRPSANWASDDVSLSRSSSERILDDDDSGHESAQNNFSLSSSLTPFITRPLSEMLQQPAAGPPRSDVAQMVRAEGTTRVQKKLNRGEKKANAMVVTLPRLFFFFLSPTFLSFSLNPDLSPKTHQQPTTAAASSAQPRASPWASSPAAPCAPSRRAGAPSPQRQRQQRRQRRPQQRPLPLPLLRGATATAEPLRRRRP